MRRWWLAAAAGAVFLLVRARPFRVAVEGPSMAPSLLEGDYLVAVRSRRIRRGDVVVVRHPDRGFEVVKRVAGLPGESALGWALGPEEFLVVGDNPTRSTDGRMFGPVRRQDIAGVVRLRYWPRPGRVRSAVG